MTRLFNYRPDGQTITTNNGDVLIMAIRRGPRGIVSVVRGVGPVVIWDNNDADAHIGDAEGVLIQKTIDVLNA